MTALPIQNRAFQKQTQTTPFLKLAVDTGAVQDELLAFRHSETAALAKQWDALLEQIRGWWVNRRELDADDFAPPTYEAVASAMAIAEYLKSIGFAPPFQILPSVNEGAIFKWKPSGLETNLEIYSDGSMEVFQFLDSRVISRRPLGSLAQMSPSA